MRYQYFIRTLELPNESYSGIEGEKTKIPDLILGEGERIVQVSEISGTFNFAGAICVALIEREVR